MPNVVTHFIITAILIALVRDFYFKKKYKKNYRELFPLHYVLIGGIAGILPDFDYLFYYFLSYFGFVYNQVHRTFSHNVFVPILFLFLGFLLINYNVKSLSKYNLKISTIIFILSFGSFIHIFLDLTTQGSITPFYPFYNLSFGLDLVGKLPNVMQNSFTSVLDAIILIIWMIYIEINHKISNFI